MSSNDLPMGDRKISEMLGNPDSETGSILRTIIHNEIEPDNLASKEYVTAMIIAFG